MGVRSVRRVANNGWMRMDGTNTNLVYGVAVGEGVVRASDWRLEERGV